MTMRTSLTLVTLLLSGLLFVACDSNDGPMEETGEAIDQAANDAANAVEDACEDVSGSDCK